MEKSSHADASSESETIGIRREGRGWCKGIDLWTINSGEDEGEDEDDDDEMGDASGEDEVRNWRDDDDDEDDAGDE